ncbi:MAG: helix-turn-helix domain-containing protein [Pseudonocardia sp.]
MGEAAFRRNQELQRELYGEPLGDRLRRLQAALAVNQARLAEALGVSPTMLSQLISGRRVKIGNPVVLARLVLLDERARALGHRPAPASVDGLLEEIRRARPRLGSADWSAVRPVPPQRQPHPSAQAADAVHALRELAGPAVLNAAAATLAPRFPALAAVFHRAARP